MNFDAIVMTAVVGGEGLIEFCPYCRSKNIKMKYRRHFHKMSPGYGPFDFFVCEDCGCGFNNPMPSNDQIRRFYSSYSSGMPEEFRAAMKQGQDSSWHSQIAYDLLEIATEQGFESDFTWLDVGAGAGEIAEKLSRLSPKSCGTCVDLHQAPERIDGSNINWLQQDINSDFSSVVGKKFKLVYASAVLEHVVDPERFLINCLDLTEPGGAFYFFCPDYSSLAAKVMGQRWPYYLPGEHVTLPTKNSIRACLSRFLSANKIDDCDFHVRSKRVSYSVQYMLFALKLRWLGKFFPFDFSLKFPTGALEAILVKRKKV